MQKFSETVYANLFWLISGLLVWLVIVPLALICFPVMLVISVGQVLFKMLLPNQAKAETKSQATPKKRPANAVELLLTSLLMTILIEVPAQLAAVISLQPTRLITGDRVLAQNLQPQAAKGQGEPSTDTIEIAADENTGGTSA